MTDSQRPTPAISSLAVFFPCYNEEANVGRVTAQAVEVCRSLTDDFEVIIVNDGSADRTAEIAAELEAEYAPVVRAINHPVNRGYGGALQSGFRAASKEWVFYTDGDGQFDMRELPELLPYLDNGADVVSGYRINRQDPWNRKLNAWAWGCLVRALFRLPVRDIDCAFKLYRREIFDDIEMLSEGALIDTEVLARIRRAGYTIVQHGVHHYPRTAGTQTGANIKVILRAFKELFMLRKAINRTPAGTPAKESSKQSS